MANHRFSIVARIYLRRTLFTFVMACAFSSCGTATKVSRRQALPDAALPPAEVQSSTTPAEVAAPRSKSNEVKLTPLQQRLTELLADSLFESTQLGLSIVDLTTGFQIISYGDMQRMRPASTEKVVTAIAALSVLGPDYNFTTQLLTKAPQTGSTLGGDVYVKGGMDPLLSAVDVSSLAAQLKAAGIFRINGRLIADVSFKDTDRYGWGWCWDDENPTLSPMLCAGKPILMDQLSSALRAQGITVARGISTGNTPAGARQLAVVKRPLTAVLQPMMKESDNLCAESVFYQMGRTRKQVAAVIEGVMQKAVSSSPQPWTSTVPASSIADGSGLSLYNYQSPAMFTRLLTYAALNPVRIYNPLLASLPIAGIDGTLKKRMAGTPAEANTRAKTGSVTAVSTLVGYTTQRSTGHLIAFAIMNQGVRTMAEGRNFQDRVCSILSE